MNLRPEKFILFRLLIAWGGWVDRTLEWLDRAGKDSAEPKLPVERRDDPRQMMWAYVGIAMTQALCLSAFLLAKFQIVDYWVPLVPLCFSGAIVCTLVLLPDIRAYRATRRQRRGLCPACGYDLTVNLSGTCPECGRLTPRKDSGI